MASGDGRIRSTAARAVLQLLALAWAGAAAAQGADASALLRDHEAARQAALASDRAAGEARDRLGKACDDSKAADRELHVYAGTAAPELARLATRAQAAHASCVEAGRAEKTASDRLAAASSLLRESASRLARCLARQADCSSPAPDGAVALVADAGKAQAAMDKLRKKGAGAYDTGDAGTEAFLELDLGKSHGGMSDAVRADVLAWGEDAQVLPGELRASLLAAQRAADRYVGAAGALKRCRLDAAADCGPALAEARAAQDLFARLKARSASLQERLDRAGYGLAVVADAEVPATDRAALDKQIAFRKILDSNADVKSYFGGDAVGWSAGTAGSSATIRYTMQDRARFGVNRLSLIGSTPVGGSGVTRFVDAADKLKDKTSLSLVWQRTNAPFSLPLNVVNDFAFGLKATREKHDWKEPGSTPTDLVGASRTVTAGEASLQWAFLFNGASEARSLLLLNLARQRAYKDADEVVRCPFDPAGAAARLVDCDATRLGAPSVAYNTVNALELRQRLGAVDLGLKVTHSRTDSKTDFELPLYFIRNLDDKTDTPFSGGLSLHWSSASPGLKWGLFVSTPLSFTKSTR